jgi:hypothetical protein
MRGQGEEHRSHEVRARQNFWPSCRCPIFLLCAARDNFRMPANAKTGAKGFISVRLLPISVNFDRHVGSQ